MAYENYIVLDVETNGVDPSNDGIIEFAAVRLDSTGRVVDTLDLLIATPHDLNPTVIDITGITPAMLEGRPTFDEVKSQIVDFIGDSPIIGHSVSIDVDFLNGHGANLSNDILDTFELASTILPAQEAYSLEYLSYHYQFPHKPAHRAMADVMATVDLARFLVSLPVTYPVIARDKVKAIIPEGLWNWQWIFHTHTWEGVEHVANSYSLQTQTLLADLKEAMAYLPEIKKARTSDVSFIEYHEPSEPLALNLAYALDTQPSVLLVSPKQLKDIDWTGVGKEVGVNIVTQTGTNLRYRTGALEESAARPDLITSPLARLMIKIILWLEVWNQDYNQLHLSSDEFRLWETRFNDTTVTLSKPSKKGVVVTLTQHLLNLEVDPAAHIVIPSPLMVEAQTLKSQIKTLSGYFFNWAISSRRDFLHTVVKAEDVKLSDALFKTLNQASTLFEDLEHNLIALYHSNPPSNLLDREIELTPDHITDEIKTVIHALVTSFTEYLEGLRKLDSGLTDHQITETYKLVDYLTALQLAQPSYRYMLYADGSRFFLDLVPERPDFSQLTEKLSAAASFTAISPGLSFGRADFGYFQKSWPAFKGVVLEDKTKLAELLIVEDVKSPHSTDYLIDLLYNRTGRHLVLLSSGLEAHTYFEKYFDLTLKGPAQSGSCELLGRYKGLSGISESYKTYLLFTAYSCLDKIKRDLSTLEDIFVFKLPADRSTGMKYGGMMDATDESKLDALTRQTLRFKEVLHDLRRSGKPIILADPWLNTPGGKKVLKSLRGFLVIPVDQKEVI